MDWDDLFPGKTPEQVKADLAADSQKLAEATQKAEEWKGHARTWEDRSKDNHTKLKQVEDELVKAREVASGAEGSVDAATAAELRQRAEAAEGELTLTRKLTSLGVDAAALMDSKSFMDSLGGLDPDSEEYEKDFTDLVESRTKSPAGPFVPNYPPGVRRHVSGGDLPKPSLWDEVHGEKKTNTL